MMVLVSYDVCTLDRAGTRRLRRIAKICTNFGQRVQFSVFECLVDPAQWTKMKQQLLAIMVDEQDSLRFYFLGANWKQRVEHFGTKKATDLEGPLIV
jgi:CRISPR-associated protein Cas2